MTDPHHEPLPEGRYFRGDDAPRRNFMVELAAVVTGGIISLFGLIAGLFVFLDPLARDKKVPLAYRDGEQAEGDKFVRVATIDSVPSDGTPRLFPVLADRVDAWNYFPNEPVGAIYLRRDGESGQVQALHATCPHLGCTIAFAGESERFQCPCHDSAFELDGERINQPGKINPAPRRMDQLEVDAERLEASGEIWVQFKNYQTGEHEQIPKA